MSYTQIKITQIKIITPPRPRKNDDEKVSRDVLPEIFRNLIYSSVFIRSVCKEWKEKWDIITPKDLRLKTSVKYLHFPLVQEWAKNCSDSKTKTIGYIVTNDGIPFSCSIEKHVDDFPVGLYLDFNSNYCLSSVVNYKAKFLQKKECREMFAEYNTKIINYNPEGMGIEKKVIFLRDIMFSYISKFLPNNKMLQEAVQNDLPDHKDFQKIFLKDKNGRNLRMEYLLFFSILCNSVKCFERCVSYLHENEQTIEITPHPERTTPGVKTQRLKIGKSHLISVYSSIFNFVVKFLRDNSIEYKI